MIKNYLDLLTDDLLEKILDIVVVLNIKDIRRIADNLKKVSKKMKNISITLDCVPDDIEEDKINEWYVVYNNNYNITSKHITYCLDNYLYDRMPYHSICVIESLEHITPYIPYDTNDPEYERFIIWIASKRFKSKIVKNPIYLDCLLLLDDITDKKQEILQGDNHNFLEGIIVEPYNRVKDVYNFEPIEGITYLNFMLGS